MADIINFRDKDNKRKLIKHLVYQYYQVMEDSETSEDSIRLLMTDSVENFINHSLTLPDDYFSYLRAYNTFIGRQFDIEE